MVTRNWLRRGKPHEVAILFAGIMVAFNNVRAQDTRRGCPEEFAKSRVDILHDKNLHERQPDLVRGAILELGQRRCLSVIADLTRLLTFRFEYPRPGEHFALQPVYTGTLYPATKALSEIGQAALPALVKVIETNDESSLLSKNARYTVRAIFLYDRSQADKFFKDAATKATTPETRRRLLRALETAEEDFRSD